ncbi:MAG: Flp pilus assembly complex ATPase component TadA, partial [Myxococcales bacterium]|nr:Flp pilus assembly complex ATPase component TadA [Myxococcales bacterium]
VAVMLPPAARAGACMSIRRFPKERLTVERLLDIGALTPACASFLRACVVGKRNVVVAGGTGSGKTSMLNALSSFVPEGERILVLEDSSELQLQQEHAVYMESIPPDARGRGAVTIRDLLRASLRMRPDRIVVGEKGPDGREKVAEGLLEDLGCDHRRQSLCGSGCSRRY